MNLVRAICLNVGANAAVKAAACMQLFPGCAVYAFLETMADRHTCLEISRQGFTAVHCTRPRAGTGRPHGGITVLLDDNSPVVGQHVPKHIWHSAFLGIVCIQLPRVSTCLCLSYISPHTSNLYDRGVLPAQPIPSLLDVVQSHVGEGYQIILLGDLNVRVGLSSADVVRDVAAVAVPPGASHLVQHFIGAPVAGIPPERQSHDRGGDSTHRNLTETLMLGLHASGCVVLNGRAPGDTHGAATFFKRLEGRPPATSVVDLAIVSSSLYPLVDKLEVLPFNPAISLDHCALRLSIALPDSPHRSLATHSHAPQRRAWRPVGAAQVQAFCAALHNAAPHFQACLASMQAAHMPLNDALQRIRDILLSCVTSARGVCAAGQLHSGRGPTQGAPGKAVWWNATLDVLKADRIHTWSLHLRAPLDVVLRAQALAARTKYKHACKRAAFDHRQATQVRHLHVFFSRRQRDFWKVFLGKHNRAQGQCAIADVSQWTRWFRNLMQPPVRTHVNDPDLTTMHSRLAEVAASYHADMSRLNDPVTLSELLQTIRRLPAGRAADADGLTCELLKLAATPAAPAADGAHAAHVAHDVDTLLCPGLMQCMLHIVNNMHSLSRPPTPLAVSKLTPVPKACQQAAPMDMNNYRGISVSSVFSKVVDRLLHARLDSATESQGLRSPTQCGFRKGLGTLDAIFTLNHLIAQARHQSTCLYVLFVDFKKAFDTVDRSMMLDRCRNLGISGPFLQVLELLYSQVQQQVYVDGRLGDLFDTYVGTKQGSELSPLLFGMFIDMLRELVCMELPGAGPVIGSLRVPQIEYADDVAMMNMADPDMLQQYLRVLDLFCAIFKMTVSFSGVDKTCAVAFRLPRASCRRPVLRFRDVIVPWAEVYKYLGVQFHATKGMTWAAKLLAECGHRAMHALLGKCREQCLTQFDFKCRLFDCMVMPLMSYGAHVWGPEIFHPIICQVAQASPLQLEETLPLGRVPAERIHNTFLRVMSGVGDHCAIDVLLRDFQRTPVMFRWVVFAARWFTRVAAMTPTTLSHNVLRADIQLALDGCTQCWSYYFLSTAGQLNLIRSREWDASLDPAVHVDSILRLATRFSDRMVTFALLRLLHLRWNGLHHDPRNAPSPRLQRCVHAAWVMPIPTSGPLYSPKKNKPAHMLLCTSFKALQCLARLRMGWHALQVRVGVYHGQHVRASRVCPLCGVHGAPFAQHSNDQPFVGEVEDVMHFAFDCPAYANIRRMFTDIFPLQLPDRTADAGVACMRSFFAHQNQSSLARCVLLMTEYRQQCLQVIASAPPGVDHSAGLDAFVARVHAAVHQQPHIVEQDMDVPLGVAV